MSYTIDEITHDTEIDAAYIRLVETPDDEQLTALAAPDHSINLDFDSAGNLVRIETLDASNRFPDELLEQAREL